MQGEEKTSVGAGPNSRCFSWRVLDVHGAPPSPAEKGRKREHTPHHCWPDTGGHLGVPLPHLSSWLPHRAGVGGGGLTPSRPAPAMLSSWPFMQEERGAMRPLPGKGSGPLCTSTFSCCPVSSHLL